MSLFRTKGGKPSTKRVPSDAEGLALAVGIAMQWGKLRDCSNKNFFVNVGNECSGWAACLSRGDSACALCSARGVRAMVRLAMVRLGLWAACGLWLRRRETP